MSRRRFPAWSALDIDEDRPLFFAHMEIATGCEWVVDARGCTPAALRDPALVRSCFERVVSELGLNPVGPAFVHAFPGAGGVTGLLPLAESHLACHTFPEHGYAAFNLYCCRPRPEWAWRERLTELFGAREVTVQRLERR
jgi:S-adenosylmethionine decarboxylase